MPPGTPGRLSTTASPPSSKYHARAPAFSAVSKPRSSLASTTKRSWRASRSGGHARQDVRAEARLVARLMEVVEHRALTRQDVGADLLHEARARQRLRVLREPHLAAPDLVGDPAQGPLEAAQGLAQEADVLVEAHELGLEAGGGTEVDDLDGPPSGDPVEAADALLHLGGIARQVEEHEPAAELEVAPLAAALGGDQEGGAFGATELRHLQVAAVRGQVLVEDRHAPARRRLQAGLQALQGRPVVNEDERLALGLPAADPGARRRGQPDHPRIARVLFVLAGEARTGPGVAVEVHGLGHARRDAAHVHAPGGARAGRQRPARLEGGHELVFGAVRVRAQQLEEPEEAVEVGFEGRRREQQRVAGGGREGRDRAVGRASRMPASPLQAMRLVHHEDVQAGPPPPFARARAPPPGPRGRRPSACGLRRD